MTDDSLRLLILVRHAHARNHSRGGDLDRELDRRGRAEADAVGAWLVGQGVRPDLVLLSPSARTRETWARIAAAGLEPEQVRIEETIYDADVADLVDAIAAAGPARVVLVVGHAPGIPALATSLGTDRLDDRAREVAQDWPTGTLAVISHGDTWDEFATADTVLIAVHAP